MQLYIFLSVCLRLIGSVVICSSIMVTGFAQPKFKGIRENLGKEVNDEFDQVNPVFATDGSILYFSQGSGPNLQYQVWHTLSDTAGRITGKQKIGALHPNITGARHILGTQSSHRFLVNGVFEVNGGRLQYSRGLSAIDLTKAGETFNPALFQKWPNPILDSLFRRHTFYPRYHSFTQVYYWSMDKDGQTDIYFLVSRKDSSTIIKLPAAINTLFNETTPWLDDEGRYLYFASNRPGGFGETDIWVTERLDGTFTKWSTPVNSGPAINTNKSESDFIIDPGSTYAYFASDKSGFGRNDLFRIALQQADSTAGASPLLLIGDRPDTSVLFQPQTHVISNIVFLLDISHSMAQSRKMVTLKKAMYRLAQQLRPADRISIITFGGSVEMLLAPKYVKNKADMLDAIQLLSANGGATNISAGLQWAYEQATQHFLPGGNNQVMLVTDGVFKLKPSDEQRIVQHTNILLTAVVVGNDEAVDKALTPILQRAGGQLLHLQNESADLNLLLQNVRANARIKK